jgi:protein subunit release factor B
MVKKSLQELVLQLKKLGVDACNLEEKFIIGSGPGGQNLQKTASCVWLKDSASGIEVKCQLSRSREENRRLARQMLCEIIIEKRRKLQLIEKASIAKMRREKRVRSKTQKEKLVAGKRKTSAKKALRKKPKNEGAD